MSDFCHFCSKPMTAIDRAWKQCVCCDNHVFAHKYCGNSGHHDNCKDHDKCESLEPDQGFIDI